MNRILMIFLVSTLMAMTLGAQEQSIVESLEQRIRELETKVDSLSELTKDESLDEIRRQIDILAREIEALKLDRAVPITAAGDEIVRSSGAPTPETSLTVVPAPVSKVYNTCRPATTRAPAPIVIATVAVFDASP